MTDQRPFCASSPEAAAMSDADFWSHVYPDTYDGPTVSAPALDDDLQHQLADPCPECGASGACAWDDEGRPLIHTTKGDD